MASLMQNILETWSSFFADGSLN